jgi:hypothetical protein
MFVCRRVSRLETACVFLVFSSCLRPRPAGYSGRSAFQWHRRRGGGIPNGFAAALRLPCRAISYSTWIQSCGRCRSTEEPSAIRPFWNQNSRSASRAVPKPPQSRLPRHCYCYCSATALLLLCYNLESHAALPWLPNHAPPLSDPSQPWRPSQRPARVLSPQMHTTPNSTSPYPSCPRPPRRWRPRETPWTSRPRPRPRPPRPPPPPWARPPSTARPPRIATTPAPSSRRRKEKEPQTRATHRPMATPRRPSVLPPPPSSQRSSKPPSYTSSTSACAPLRPPKAAPTLTRPQHARRPEHPAPHLMGKYKRKLRHVAL